MASSLRFGTPRCHWLGRLTVLTILLFGSASLVRAAPAAAAVSSGSWQATGSMHTPRGYFTATLLPNGQVLVAGGRPLYEQGPVATAELYDPATGSWTVTGSMQMARLEHTATLLDNGKVLVVGGRSIADTQLASTELYDPVTGGWTLSGTLAAGRSAHTATRLADGNVLVTGGEHGRFDWIASAEVYDSSTGRWRDAGTMRSTRVEHTAALLADGRVLVAGGYTITPQCCPAVATADVYNPQTNRWSAAASLGTGRAHHRATVLGNGQVLVTGGFTDEIFADIALDTAERYDPVGNTWQPATPMTAARSHHTSTLLPDGRVLVIGGLAGKGDRPGFSLATTEMYDPETDSWIAGGTMTSARWQHTATLLDDGRVLAAGGQPEDLFVATASAELFTLPSAATIGVTTTADELNADGDCALREAIRAANTDTAVDACAPGRGADTIVVPAGTYTLALAGVDEDAAQSGDLDITADLTLIGAGADRTIIDGNALDRIFEIVAAPTVTITGVTVQHGFHGAVWPDDEPLGAGIRINGGRTILDQTRFIQHTGHAIHNHGELTLRASLVADNTAEGIVSTNQLTIIDSTITRNHHTTWCCGGGGISADGTTLIVRSTISDNTTATGGGGGILNWRRMTIVDSTISGNATGVENPATNQGSGGGIFNTSGGTLTVINSTLSHNAATLDGGGIHTDSIPEGVGILNLVNATLAHNTADADHSGQGDGGGLHNDGVPPTVHNTIIAYNSDPGGEAADCGGRMHSQGYNLIGQVRGCTVEGNTAGNQTGVDARLGPLMDNGGPTATHGLQSGSPAIDRGNPAAPGGGGVACAAADQRGVARPQDGDRDGTARCDIGAVELAPQSNCPAGPRAIARYRYTLTRNGRTIELTDLTFRVQPGDGITAHVTVAPGCRAVPIGLAAYEAQAPSFDPELEQHLVAQDMRLADTGEHTLTVVVPTCYFQVDLVVGAVLERVGPPSDYYGPRAVDYATGGSSPCAGFGEGAGRTTPEAGPHTTFLGLVQR